MNGQESQDFNKALPRGIPEGTIPLIDVEGTAYECGRCYAEIVTKEYPLFREYIDITIPFTCNHSPGRCEDEAYRGRTVQNLLLRQ